MRYEQTTAASTVQYTVSRVTLCESGSAPNGEETCMSGTTAIFNAKDMTWETALFHTEHRWSWQGTTSSASQRTVFEAWGLSESGEARSDACTGDNAVRSHGEHIYGSWSGCTGKHRQFVLVHQVMPSTPACVQ